MKLNIGVIASALTLALLTVTHCAHSVDRQPAAEVEAALHEIEVFLDRKILPPSRNALENYLRTADAADTAELIQLLVGRIGLDSARVRIGVATASFAQLRLARFRANLTILDEAMGAALTNQILNRTFSGLGAKPENLRESLIILRARLPEAEFARRVATGMDSIGRMDPAELRKVIAWVEKRLGTERTNAMMLNDLLGFGRANEQRLSDLLEFLGNYLTQPGEIDLLLEKDLHSLALTSRKKVAPVVTLIRSYIGPEGVAARMRIDLSGFARTDFDKLSGVLAVLSDYGLTKADIRNRMNADLVSFASTDAETLSGVIARLEEYGLRKAEILTSMRSGLLGFALTDAQKLSGVIAVLEKYGLTREEILARMRADLQGFARTDAKKLSGVIAALERLGLTPEEIRHRMRANLQSLAGTDAKGLLGTVAALKRRGLTDADALKRLRGDLLTLVRTSEEKIESLYVLWNQVMPKKSAQDFRNALIYALSRGKNYEDRYAKIVEQLTRARGVEGPSSWLTSLARGELASANTGGNACDLSMFLDP